MDALAQLTETRRTAEAAWEAHKTPANLAAYAAADQAEMDAVLAASDARQEVETAEATEPVQTPAELTTGRPAWFRDLVAQDEQCTNVEEFEHAAYRGYVAYGRSMTDGYYAPEDFSAWVKEFRSDPVGELYRGDARYALAPAVRSYMATLTV